MVALLDAFVDVGEVGAEARDRFEHRRSVGEKARSALVEGVGRGGVGGALGEGRLGEYR